MLFDKNYHISGIVEGDEPYVYMNRADYVNFLGVYGEIYFTDRTHLFFKDGYTDSETNSTVNGFLHDIADFQAQ